MKRPHQILDDDEQQAYDQLKNHVNEMVGVACYSGLSGVTEFVNLDDDRIIRVRLSLVDVKKGPVFQ